MQQLREALAGCDGDELEIFLAMGRAQPVLENALDASHFRLGCTPAVNLFPRQTDRIHVTSTTTELHLVADRNRPADFEIFSLERLQAIGVGGESISEVAPLYAADHRTDASRPMTYYTLQRRPRLLPMRQQQSGTRAGYVGSECYLSLVDTGNRHLTGEIRQLDAEALCTNRDLPIQLAAGQGTTDFHVEGGAPADSIRCIAGPSYPRPSAAFGDTAWRLISHLSLNYLSLDGAGTATGADMLRNMLALYADPNDAAVARQIEGVRTVSYRPVIRRMPRMGPASYGRGLEITLTFDEPAFEGVGLVPLASVLERFFARYVSINAFTQVKMQSSLRGDIKTWPVRLGCRQTL